jgi:hypothetical protein
VLLQYAAHLNEAFGLTWRQRGLMHLPFPELRDSSRLHVARFGLFVLAVWFVSALSILAQDDSGSASPPDNSAGSPGSVNSNPGTDGQNQAAPAPDPSQGQSPDDASGPITSPPGGATFQTFYDSLSSQGNWVQTDDYGYVWQPNVQDPNWAPYTDGNWVYTDDGWTWNSSEPFGWATYHYGRWVNLAGSGWAWVPGYTWAPAWVSWRYGDGYVGWAPLPPDSFAGIDYFGDDSDADFGFHIGGDSDSFYGIGPAIYIFLPIGCVGYHDYHHWYHNRSDNFALINHTTNVTNINVARGGTASGGRAFTRVTTGGPQVAQVDAASETPVTRATLVRSNSPGTSRLTGNSLSVFAPHIQAAGADARPAQVTSNLGVTAVNRGTDVLHPPAVNARLAPAPATDAQVAAAQDAIGHAPSSAKVMTDAASVRPTLPGPITAMRSVASPWGSTASRTFSATPGTVYNNSGGHTVFGGPVHMPSTTMGGGQTPSERTSREVQSTPQRVYSPNAAPTFTPNYTPSGGNTPAESHTYTHVSPTPTYTPSPAPAERSTAPSGGGAYNGGNRGGSGYNNGGNSNSNGQRH